MTGLTLAAHRSTAGTLAGASGALLVLTLIAGLSIYLGHSRKIRGRPAQDSANLKYARAEAKRVLVATLTIAAALFALLVATTAIRSTQASPPTKADTSAQTTAPVIGHSTPAQHYRASQPPTPQLENTIFGFGSAKSPGLREVPTSN